jgi:hypothetical protein
MANGRATKLMHKTEEKFTKGMPIRDYLKQAINGDHSMTEVAEHLEVSKATLGYWLLRMDLRVRRVCVEPGDRVLVLPAHSDTAVPL